MNSVGIAGVAPEATLIALKACTRAGYCFADSVAAALRYAGNIGVDVVNLSLFADPYLYYCKSDAEQIDCPANWSPLGASDERERCYGLEGRTSFFGTGLVDAEAASQE